MARHHASKGPQKKTEYISPVWHDYDSDNIILEIIVERFVVDLQDLIKSVEENKSRMSISNEDYNLTHVAMWDLAFWEKCNKTQTSLNRIKIVRHFLKKLKYD